MKNERVDKLKRLGRAGVEALAKARGVRVEKTVVGTARAIEKREYTDKRTAQKIPLIKEIF